MSNATPECCICLQSANIRGGSPLFTPGCCGAWFHQSCVEQLLASGQTNCPACRASIQAIVNTSSQQPQPTVVQGQTSFFSRFASIFGFGSSGPAPAVSAPNAAPAPTPALAFPPQLRQFPTRTHGSGSRGFGSRRSFNRPRTVEEDVEPFDPSLLARPSLEVSEEVELSIYATPEYCKIGISAKPSLFINAGLRYNSSEAIEAAKVPLDLVCILDNSGSMDGGKLESLKNAMTYIISTLTSRDRLSVINFNSTAECMHELIKMTPENKEISRQIVSSLDARGGTCILSGMTLGWERLSNRRTSNPTSCVFLLTDGQDPSNLSEKQELARKMKSEGTSLFVFGFGADHDSAHMNSVANAAEGLFTYIESDDTVIDAFGGAIGTQQGKALKNITFSIATTSAGIKIKNTRAGSYAVTSNRENTGCQIQFLNLYAGEFRDVLLELEIPAVSSEIAEYPLISATANYCFSHSPELIAVAPTTCSVERIADNKIDATLHRDINVDVQVNRLLAVSATEIAMSAADSGDFKRAKLGLEDALAQLKASVSFAAGNRVVLGLVVDLQEALSKVSDRSEYRRGGRATMQENLASDSYQRSCYTKRHKAPTYQSASSVTFQKSAMQTKKL